MKALLLVAALLAVHAFAEEKAIKNVPIRLMAPGETLGFLLTIEHQDSWDVDLATLRSADHPDAQVYFAGQRKEDSFTGANLTIQHGKPVIDKEILLGLGFSPEKRRELFAKAEELYTAMQSMAHLKLLYKEKANFVGLMIIKDKVAIVTKVP